MPLGHPESDSPPGRDWVVLLSKWALLVSVPVLLIVALPLAFGETFALPALLICGFVVAAAAGLLLMAWSDGGWDRLRRTPLLPKQKTEEEKVEELRTSSPGYRVFFLVCSVLAVGGAVAAVVAPAKPNYKAAVKLGLAGAFGIWRWRKSRPEETGPTSTG